MTEFAFARDLNSQLILQGVPERAGRFRGRDCLCQAIEGDTHHEECFNYVRWAPSSMWPLFTDGMQGKLLKGEVVECPSESGWQFAIMLVSENPESVACMDRQSRAERYCMAPRFHDTPHIPADMAVVHTWYEHKVPIVLRAWRSLPDVPEEERYKYEVWADEDRLVQMMLGV